MLGRLSFFVFAALASFLQMQEAAHAQLNIDLIGGGANQITVTILPFAGEERFVQHTSQIVSADLQRSGLFRLGSVGSVRPFPTEPSEINYRYWVRITSASGWRTCRR